MTYQLLDVFFLVFHSVLILFNLLGWMWKKTQKLNLLTLSLTAFSWIILGIWYGLGYCPCTHWHWLVRMELGYEAMPDSYIKFLVDKLTGLDVSAFTIDLWTGILFTAAFAASLYVNLKSYRAQQNRNPV